MKELTIEQKAKNYDEAIERANELKYVSDKGSLQRKTVERIFPELKESEDERIREELVEHFKWNSQQVLNEFANKEVLAWLEKKRDNISIDFVLGYLGIKPAYKDGNAWCILLGDNIQEGICGFGDTKEEALIAFIKELIEKQGTSAKLSEEEQNKFAKGVLTSCAMSFINYLDAHKYDGKMCVSNGECEDIENAFHNAMWDRLHRYYCKYIEKQGEQKSTNSKEDDVKPVSTTQLFEYAKSIKEKVDNLEPKFKVGDKIQYDKYIYTIKDVQEDCYVLDNDKVLTFNAQDVWELVEHNPNEKKPTESEEEPTAWSEDDEEMFKYAIGHFEIQKRNSIEGGLRKTSMQEFIDWIKSLKDRLV